MTARLPAPVLTLSALACCLPARVTGVHEWAARCGVPRAHADALLRNGALRFHDAQGTSPVCLAIRAVRSLLEDNRTSPGQVDLLVHACTIQTSADAAPYSSVNRIQRCTGLSGALAFSISQQNCVSPLAAIHVTQALMEQHPAMSRAIVVCADVIGSGCDPLRAVGELALHSDGACALLLERGGACNHIAALRLFTDGRFFHGTDANAQPVPDDRYYWSAFSTMRAALAQAGVPARAVTRVLPHHVDLQGWYRLLGMLGIAPERLFTRNFTRTGHVFGADPFINLHGCGVTTPGEWSLLFSSGLAGCFGAMVIRH